MSWLISYWFLHMFCAWKWDSGRGSGLLVAVDRGSRWALVPHRTLLFSWEILILGVVLLDFRYKMSMP